MISNFVPLLGKSEFRLKMTSEVNTESAIESRGNPNLLLPLAKWETAEMFARYDNCRTKINSKLIRLKFIIY